MKNCNTCIYGNQGLCTIHHTVPGECNDYMQNISIDELIELQEYRKLGTIEEVKKAVEKTKAKKAKSKNSIKCCPLCGAIAQKDFGLCCSVEYFYCVNCGQKLE